MSGVIPATPATPDAAVAALPAGAVPNAEYAAKMASATLAEPVIAPPTPAAGAKVRPDYVPEKFWDAEKGEARWEDFGKAYGALETKLSTPKPAEAEADAAAAEAAQKGTKIVPEETPAEGDPAPAPFLAPMTALQEAHASGEVSEDHIKAVADAGIPRQFVDTYLAGVEALQTVSMQAVHTAAGGKEAYDEATTWAASNLSETDLAYYNDNVDTAARTQTVEWLMSKFKAAVPSEGKLVQTNGQPGVGDVFTSETQMTAAMASQQYKTDPAFRQQVAEKVLRSQRSGALAVQSEFHKRA